jgi:hypothetical protein
VKNVSSVWCESDDPDMFPCENRNHCIAHVRWTIVHQKHSLALCKFFGLP